MPQMNIGTAGDIINRVAAEVGLRPVVDPYASEDDAFIQMQYLLDIAGEELVMAYPWEFLSKPHQIITALGDTGEYDLPADFAYMIQQTGWEKGQNVPLGGGLTPQEWTYLKGRDFGSSTIYASFRLAQGKFNIYPSPPPVGLDINFEYISLEWTEAPTSTMNTNVTATESGTIVKFDKTLISRLLKAKFLEASGFESSKAQADFATLFNMMTGKDKSPAVLNQGSGGGGYPYLDGANVPYSHFGNY